MQAWLPGLAGGRLILALVLTLLPGVALGVLGLRGLKDKELGLRTHYTATTVLVRDRLAAELSRMESALRADIGAISPDRATGDAPAHLERLVAERPWMADPFLLTEDGAVVTTTLAADASSRRGEIPALPATLASALREAETAEFARADLADALRRYRDALPIASAPSTRGLVVARIGRVLFRLRRFEDAIGQYTLLYSLPEGTRDSNGIPYAVIARSQIIDAHGAANRTNQRTAHQSELLAYLVEHPWNVDDGYGYYFERALSSAPVDAAMTARVGVLRQSVSTIEWVRREVLPRIGTLSANKSASVAAIERLAATRDGQPVALRCVTLRETTPTTPHGRLCYAIDPGYMARSMLVDVLKTVDLGSDLTIALVDERQRLHSTSTTTSLRSLGQADLGEFLPGWQVGLFDRQGRSIEQLVARERWTYGALIAGIVFVLVSGVCFTLRASVREAELVHLKTEFVSNVSHELKTPLALIRMFGETLESGIVGDEAKRIEFSAVIRRESERLTHLINNVLDVARIEAGTKQYTFERIDIVQVVRDAVETYRPFFDRLGFAVSASLPDSALYVDADRDAIAQALVNLFQNSIKYSEAEKHVTVSVTAAAGEVRIAVADRGVGIASEDRGRIFERYYRVRVRAGTTAQGSGLGLAIVKHAIEAHGGHVGVESLPGEGSVFTLALPVKPSDSPETVAAFAPLN
ncbi:MAG: HAMP domain-containing histidine kinase [Acidobacteriota bacterium]|nr:HAMP domain-containing histidine kinase [Acidobacteriota bacterium]